MPIELSPHLVAWTRQLRDQPIPVLADSLDALRQLAVIEQERGDVDAHRIDDEIGSDPLATLWILVEAARRRRANQITPVETVTAAIIMMGIGAFFRAAEQLQAAEDLLADQPEALEGLRRHLRRMHRASRFVQGGAVHRMDDEIALLRCTTLLHGSAELLLWCHAPALMLQLEALRAAEPALEAAEAEQRVLHLTLAELEQALLHTWHLPERLLRLNDEHPEGAALVQPQRRLIQLATALARHDSFDWDAQDQPPEFGEFAELLQLTPPALRQLLTDVDL